MFSWILHNARNIDIYIITYDSIGFYESTKKSTIFTDIICYVFS